MSRVFFVTGRGRSGTWLLQSILSRHPEICLAPESLFTMLLRKKYGRITAWGIEECDRFLKDLFREEKIPLWWELDREKVRNALYQASEQGQLRGYGDVCHQVYTCYAEKACKPSATWVGDKNPEYSLWMEQLLELFPDTVFLHMIRDPRDTILSYQKVNFDLNAPVALAERWRLYNRHAIIFSRKYPDNIRFIKFEQLLTNPAAVLEECFSLLGLPPCPDILERNREHQTILSYNANIQSPLDPGRCEQWKRTPEGQALPKAVHHQCREEIQSFGYEAGPAAPPNLADRFRILQAAFISHMEKGIFALPPFLSLPLLSAYRRKTGVLERTEAGT